MKATTDQMSNAQYENQNPISHRFRDNSSSASICSNSLRNCISQKKFNWAILIYIRRRSTATGSSVIGAIPLILKACASIPLLAFGKALHSDAVKFGVESDVKVGTSLIDMYGKCQDIVSSRKVFDNMPDRNVVSWNAMIGGYMRNGDTRIASALFESMTTKTPVTWIEMIDGYARNGDMVMAKLIFDSVPQGFKNVITWTVMVDAYACKGDMEAAREVFGRMMETNFYAWSVMIAGYFRVGDVVKAREVFDGMSVRNLVNWNSLISGYAQNGMCEEALNAFRRMQEEGFEPDEVTVASVLSACAQSGLLDVGKEIHESILHKGMELSEYVVNGLVDMYSKCGDLGTARLIFEGTPVKKCVPWNSLITGFAIHGQCREAIEYFGRMEESGVKPDDVTFLSVLSACAHGGLVEQGLEAFAKMEQYGLKPNIMHYGCLVDLLGRSGKLQDAFDLVKQMPMAPNDTVLGALLGACRVHSDYVMTQNVLELIDELNSRYVCNEDDERYVLLSSIYAASEKWEMAEGARKAFSATGSEKMPGYSVLLP